MTARELFDVAITLEQGDHFEYKCRDLREAESLRILMYKHRRAYEAVVGVSIAGRIKISRTYMEGSHYVVVTNQEEENQLIIHKKDGTKLMVGVSSRKEEAKIVVTHMLKDGMTNAQIMSELIGTYGYQLIRDILTEMKTEEAEDGCIGEDSTGTLEVEGIRAFSRGEDSQITGPCQGGEAEER